MCVKFNAKEEKETAIFSIKKTKNEPNWFIFYTYTRSEKIVYNELMKLDYEVFLPLSKTLSIWKNRQKKYIERVIIPNYIFVKTFENKLYEILKFPRIVSFLNCAGKPSVMRTDDIEYLRKIVDSGENVVVEPNFKEGERVRIICGPFSGHEGVLINRSGKTRFGIHLVGSTNVVCIDIEMTSIEKLL